MKMSKPSVNADGGTSKKIGELITESQANNFQLFQS